MCFVFSISGSLIFKIIKVKKKSTAELGHSDPLLIYQSDDAQITIFLELLNKMLIKFCQ